MMPNEPGPAGIPPETELSMPGPVPVRKPEYHWYHKMFAVLFITFCMEIGVFLLVFPWWPEYWDRNYFASLLPFLHPYWDNLYLRGAVSGLGVVNLYISFLEVFRLRRFSKH